MRFSVTGYSKMNLIVGFQLHVKKLIECFKLKDACYCRGGNRFNVLIEERKLLSVVI